MYGLYAIKPQKCYSLPAHNANIFIYGYQKKKVQNNTKAEIDRLAEAIQKGRKMFE